jgi:hypothetical protein
MHNSLFICALSIPATAYNLLLHRADSGLHAPPKIVDEPLTNLRPFSTLRGIYDFNVAKPYSPSWSPRYGGGGRHLATCNISLRRKPPSFPKGVKGVSAF